MMIAKRFLRSAAAAALVVSGAGAAQAGSLDVEYDISLLGMPLGKATMTGKVERARYALQIQAKLTGLAGMLSGGRGAGTASGTIAGTRVAPSSFAVTSRAGKDQRTVRMSLPGGAVRAVDIVPPIEVHEDRVPVANSHKRGVVDPIGAMLMPVSAGVAPGDPAICDRTIPVFDGAARFDVKLIPSGTKNIQSEGFTGDVAVCKARYVPIAGHRPSRKATQFMADNEDLEVWLAPLGTTGLVAPYRISIRTMVGTTVLQASRFSVDGTTVAAVSRTATGSIARTAEAAD